MGNGRGTGYRERQRNTWNIHRGVERVSKRHRRSSRVGDRWIEFEKPGLKEEP